MIFSCSPNKLIIISLILCLVEWNRIRSTNILSLFDKLEKKCYGNRTKKVGICTLKDLCHFGIYQPFLYVDDPITNLDNDDYQCLKDEICCTKACLAKGYYVGICVSRQECLNGVYHNFKTINNNIVFGERCYFDDVCCV